MKNYKKILAAAVLACSLIGAAAFAAGCGEEPPVTEPPHLHTLSKVAAKDSTCAVEGNVEYYTCSGCDKIFSDAEGEKETTAAAVKKPLSTTHGATTPHAAVDATCATQGVSAYWTCTVCEKNFTEATCEHEVTDLDSLKTPLSTTHGATTPHAAVDATCATQGVSAYWTCTVCEKNFSEAACEHEVTDLETLKTPLLTTHGATTHHDAVPATCKDEGTIEYWTCTVCNKNFSDAECTTEAANLTAPVLTTHGATTHHDAEPATCAEAGTVEYWTCTICNKNFSEEACTNELESIVDPIKTTHGATTHHDAVPETCDTDGNIEYWTCTVCNKNFSDAACTTEVENVVVPAAHKLTKTEAVAATCEEDGNNAYWTCGVCEKVFSDEACTTETTVEDMKIDATGHTPGEYHEGDAPAYGADSQNGTLSYYDCSVCDKRFLDQRCTREITDLTFVNPVIPTDGGVDQGTNIPGKTSFWKVTEGSTGTSANNGWYVYSNTDGCPNGSGLPTLHGTQDAPEYLEFTKAARFELFFVKDDLTNPGSTSNVHLGDNGYGAWGKDNHKGLYGYTFYYDMQISANGAYSLEVCGKMNSVSGFIYTFDKNVITMHVGTSDTNLASATLPGTVNLTDGAQHRITFALRREAELGLTVELYVDGYFVPLTAEGTPATWVEVAGYTIYHTDINGFGQRFSVIPEVISGEGDDVVCSTVKIHSLSITRFAPASAEETAPETQAPEATEAKKNDED